MEQLPCRRNIALPAVPGNQPLWTAAPPAKLKKHRRRAPKVGHDPEASFGRFDEGEHAIQQPAGTGANSKRRFI